MFQAHFCTWPTPAIESPSAQGAQIAFSGEKYLGTMIMALNTLVATRVSLLPQALSVDGSQKHTCICLYMQVQIENQFQFNTAGFSLASPLLYFSFQRETWLPLGSVNSLISLFLLYVTDLLTARPLSPSHCLPHMGLTPLGFPLCSGLPHGFLTEFLRKDGKKNCV